MKLRSLPTLSASLDLSRELITFSVADKLSSSFCTFVIYGGKKCIFLEKGIKSHTLLKKVEIDFHIVQCTLGVILENDVGLKDKDFVVSIRRPPTIYDKSHLGLRKIRTKR